MRKLLIPFFILMLIFSAAFAEVNQAVTDTECITGEEEPTMREYTIVRKPEPFTWDTVPVLNIDTRLWTQPIDIEAWAQICWDDEALYVHLWTKEAQIRAENTQTLDSPCEDSCLEFFFSPMPGDSRYFNIEYNLNACMYLGFGSNRYDLVRLVPDSTIFDPQPKRTEDGWEISYRVPFSFIRRFFPDFEPASGWVIRANCYKCGDLCPQEHYFSWNPVTCENPDFHRSCDFGKMILQ